MGETASKLRDLEDEIRPETLERKDKVMEEKPRRRLSDCEFNVVIDGDKLEGSLSCEGNLIINCAFSGEINSDGIVFIGRNSEVKADIKCSAMIIEGKVDGRVFVTDRIEVRRESVLSGIIGCKMLAMEESSSVKESGEPIKGDIKIFKERRQELL